MAANTTKVLRENITRLNKQKTQNTLNLEKWTEPEITRLIAFIQEHPVLYNQDMREHYKRRTLLEDLWTNIDIELNKPPGVSKEKYVFLRSKFRQFHKQFHTTGEDCNWQYYAPLKFLIPFIGRRKSKRPKYNELQHDLSVDLPRNDDNSNSACESDGFNYSDSPIPSVSREQITILSIADVDKTSKAPNFTSGSCGDLEMPPPMATSSLAGTPMRPTQSSSKMEITILTPGTAQFRNGITDVSSLFSFAPTEDRMLDFADMEEQPQSSRIEKRPKSEQFKQPTVKIEPLSSGRKHSKEYRPSSRLVKPLQVPMMDQGEHQQQTLMHSYCENMAQKEVSNNVSYSVCKSLTVNGVQKRKENCVCNMDPDAMFLHSMLPEMKHLSAKAKGEFKMKMAKILFELSWPDGDEVLD